MKHSFLLSDITPYVAWVNRVAACNTCEISRICRHKVLTRGLIYSPDILFVGEAPGDSEYVNHEPFVGPAGQELNLILSEALSNLPTTYLITNSILCTPFKDSSLSSIREPSLPEVQGCGGHLFSLIAITEPKAVVSLGKIAQKALKKLDSKYRYMHVMHPSGILQSNHYQNEHAKAVLNIRNLAMELPREKD